MAVLHVVSNAYCRQDLPPDLQREGFHGDSPSLRALWSDILSLEDIGEQNKEAAPAFGLADRLINVRGRACVSLGLLLELLVDELNVVVHLEFAPAALLIHVADLAKNLPF